MLDLSYVSTLNPGTGALIISVYHCYDCAVPCYESPNLELLSGLSLQEREHFARATKTMVLYVDDEVQAVRAAEEQAAFRALPSGYGIEQLNVLNIGAGDRQLSQYFVSLDGFRSSGSSLDGGRHHAAFAGSILSTLREPPFRRESMDAILSLHSLEHEIQPIEALREWIGLLKPGGGIGLILPDYRYTYSARNDRSKFGHKWDPCPQLLLDWHHKYFADDVILEALDTYSYRLSFDVVLRKPGEFIAFEQLLEAECPSGWQLHQSGAFPNDIY